MTFVTEITGAKALGSMVLDGLAARSTNGALGTLAKATGSGSNAGKLVWPVLGAEGKVLSGSAANSATSTTSTLVDTETSALRKISAYSAVDTGSTARTGRIDELVASNYNRLLTQDLSAQGYVYRGVNADMINIYEAQGAIAGRGGSPTYFSLDVGANGREHMFGAQMPSSPQVMLKIPTSALINPMVPRPAWGSATSGWEYYTSSYPKWGYGGFRQFTGTTNSFSRKWIVPGWSN